MTTDYNSFVELFAGLNIAYAGSETFRDRIDNKILKVPTYIKDYKKRLIKLSTIAKSFVTYPFPTIIVDLILDEIERCQSLERKIALYEELEKTALDDESEKNISIHNAFKTAFLCSGLYCLIYLVCSASISNSIHVESSKTILLLSSLIVVVWNVIVFFYSLVHPRREIMPVWPIMTILLTLIVSITIAVFNYGIHIEKVTILLCKPLFILGQDDKKYFFYAALLIAVLPIIMHVLYSLVILFINWVRVRIERRRLKALEWMIQKMAHESHKIPLEELGPWDKKEKRKKRELNFFEKVHLNFIFILMEHQLQKRKRKAE